MRSIIGICLLGFMAAQPLAAEPVNFAKQIAPILQNHCLRCHKPGNAKGDLNLTTRTALIDGGYLLPKQPEESYLLEVITSQNSNPPAMPKAGQPLSKTQVQLIRQWVTEGATWPEGIVLREKAKGDKTWWSLQKLSAAKVPSPAGLPAGWRKHPIDRFIGHQLLENKLTPSAPADKRTLIRRATYDLIGLPPTPDEVAAFLEDDSPAAYEKLIDRLLGSPHYGERWGRHWLDVVRFGESTGFERNVIIDNAWPFRDYVIKSFNEDKPFHRLIQEHLAGDVIGRDNPDVEVGTAFLVCGPYDNVSNQDPVQKAQIRANTIDEMIRATSEAFLGLTAGCARCHDHKFDPILQEDYYALYATFAGVTHGNRTVARKEERRRYNQQMRPVQQAKSTLTKQISELKSTIIKRAEARIADYKQQWTRPAIDRAYTEELFEPLKTKYIKLTVTATDTNPQSSTGFRIDEFEIWTAEDESQNVALATNGSTVTGKSRIAEDFAGAYSARLAIDGKFGARWIAQSPELTITLAKPETINRIVFSSDRNKTGARRVTTFIGEYRLEASIDGENWQQIASSADRKPVSKSHRDKRLFDAEVTVTEQRQLADWNQELGKTQSKIAQIKPLSSWWVGHFHNPKGPFHVFQGGDPQKKTKPVVAASLSTLSEAVTPYKTVQGDTEADKRLALARWITSDDNPLTPRVLANRLWHYHFGTGIVDTPSDFGYMGSKPTHPELLDWLARQVQSHNWHLKPLHKLIMMSQTYQQSTATRAAAAKIDADSRLLWRFPPRRLSAEEIRDTMLYVSGQLNTKMGGPGFRLYRYLQDNVATYVPLDNHGPETYRRAVYHQNARAARVDLMAEFDCPDNAFATPRRASTTTPLQALTLLNHNFTLEMADAFAKRVKKQSGSKEVEKQLDHAFALAFSRQPTNAEREKARAFIAQYGLNGFCRVLFNTNEFIYLY